MTGIQPAATLAGMEKDHKTDQKSPFPPLLPDFLKAVAPDPARGPVNDLVETLERRREDEAAARHIADPTFLLPGSDRTAWLVEVQIRQWNRSQKDNKAPPPPPPK